MIESLCVYLRIIVVFQQFETLFTDGLYERLGRHAVEMAQRLCDRFAGHGYKIDIAHFLKMDLMKRIVFLAVTALMTVVGAEARGTFAMQGQTFDVDTAYHDVIGPATTRTTLILTGPVRLNVYYTTTDLTNPNVDVRVVKSGETYMSCSTPAEQREQADHPGAHYFAGVNADFFSKQLTPLGTTVVDGRVLNYGSPNWVNWFMTTDKKPHIARLGDFGRPNTDVSADSLEMDIPGIGKVVQLASGNDIVLNADTITEPVNSVKMMGVRHPRTAVGYNADGTKLVLMVIDGRSDVSDGATGKEVGELLRYAGCTEGLNFDGGGSSAMYIDGRRYVNRPSDGRPRPCTNTVWLVDTTPNR